MKKKIGIVTIHTTNNYGAVLQAYATEAFLNSNGYEAELISYTNKHIRDQHNLMYKQDGRFIGYFITFVRNVFFGRLYYYKKAFANIEQICRFSKEKYNSVDEMKNVNYDILVAGSDQLWNPAITGTLDPVFFLEFGETKKKVSIASSMGSYTFSDEDKAYVTTALNRFDFLSVREEFAKKQLEKTVDIPIKVIMDPTFLLSRKFWLDNIAQKSKKYSNTTAKYIVTYFAGGNKNSHRKIIGEYAEKFKLPVWTIQYSNYTWKESSKKILGATMEDFVALIANAELVITDSFHGVAFSLNLHKNFVALTNKANPVRVQTILEKLEILDRIDMPTQQYHEIDYNKVDELLEPLRKDSVEWVLNALK